MTGVQTCALPICNADTKDQGTIALINLLDIKAISPDDEGPDNKQGQTGQSSSSSSSASSGSGEWEAEVVTPTTTATTGGEVVTPTTTTTGTTATTGGEWEAQVVPHDQQQSSTPAVPEVEGVIEGAANANKLGVAMGALGVIAALL